MQSLRRNQSASKACKSQIDVVDLDGAAREQLAKVATEELVGRGTGLLLGADLGGSPLRHLADGLEDGPQRRDRVIHSGDRPLDRIGGVFCRVVPGHHAHGVRHGLLPLCQVVAVTPGSTKCSGGAGAGGDDESEREEEEVEVGHGEGRGAGRLRLLGKEGDEYIWRSGGNGRH